MSASKTDWRALRRRIASVKVESCADGTMRITPLWRERYVFGEEGEKTPGFFTRMGCAAELEAFINARLKGRAART